MAARHVPAAVVNEATRELFEGAPATLERLGRATGRSTDFLARKAKREGWRAPEDSASLDPEELETRLMALSDTLVGDLEAASSEGRATGAYDKGKVDALSAMLRMVEKLGEMTRVPERSAEKQKRNDAELAAAFALIDARIVELACELAASLGGRDPEPGGGGAAAA